MIDIFPYYFLLLLLLFKRGKWLIKLINIYWYSPAPPEDKNNLVYYIFVLFGIGNLLPWNAVLTALDFFIQYFPGYKPDFVFGLTINCPNFVFNFLGIFYARYISLKTRIISGFLGIFCLTISMPFVTRYVEEDTAWIIMLIIIVIYGISSSFAGGAVFGLAGVFPFKYTGAVMLGNGFSGLTMNALRMIWLAIFPPSDDNSSADNNAFIGCLIYFSIASLIVIWCIFGFLWVSRTEFARYYIHKSGSKIGSFNREVISAARESVSVGHLNAVLNNTPIIERIKQEELENGKASMHTQRPNTFFKVYRDTKQ